MLRFLVSLVVATAIPLSASAGFDWLGKIDAAADGLKDREASTRLKAVRNLAKFEISWTKPYLLRALRDRDDSVRIAAARLLGSQGVEEAAPIVVVWLTDPLADLRAASAEVLGQLEVASAVPALIRALGDSDGDVRARAVAALGKIGNKEAVIPLIARLEDEKSSVRLVAVKALRDLGDPRSVVQLVGTFDDSSVEIRQAAIAAVGKLADDTAVPALLRLLRNRTVRSAAASALGDLGAADATGPLIAVLAEERSDNSYRAVAATALGRIAKRSSPAAAQRAVRALIAALADSHLRKAAREALRIAGRAAVPGLLEHLQGKLAGDPQTVVTLLSELGDSRATPALIEELGRGRLDRSLVLAALSRSGGEKALMPIASLLRSDDPEIRGTAMRALAPLVPNDARAADIIVDLLRDKESEIRVLAARYLGEMKARVAVVPLIGVVRDTARDAALRGAALGALGNIGDPRAAAVALEVLEGGDDELHRSAATALAYVGSRASVPKMLRLLDKKGSSSRLEVLRALASVLRDRPDAQARRRLLELAESGPLPSRLAALDVLGAMADPSTRGRLRKAVEHPEAYHRAAALLALARVAKSHEPFVKALRSHDDRIAGAAARALMVVGIGDQIDALARVAHKGGFAGQVNASAALARHLPAGRAPVLDGLLFHGNAMVRANAVFGLGRLRVEGARSRLARLLQNDDSWLVRMACARALSRLGRASDILEVAAAKDPSERVRTEAARALEVVFKPDPPREWRSFHFVDPTAGGAPVVGEAYGIVGSDGIGLAVYSDPRGEALIESFAPGDHWLRPKSRLSEL